MTNNRPKPLDFVVIDCGASLEQETSIKKLDDYAILLKNRLDLEEGACRPTPIISGSYSGPTETTEIVLWKNPFLTIKYFSYEMVSYLKSYYYKLLTYQTEISIGLLSFCCCSLLCLLDGPHQPIVWWIRKQFVWCVYWMGLGVLSSVGLGSGLHTFLLYLGPHIVRVTIAAYECGGLNFPEPPYPEMIFCPLSWDPNYVTSVWNIIWKVKLEALMWGVGTALGELPPYFMAKAARLSMRDLDTVTNEQAGGPSGLNRRNNRMEIIERVKICIEEFVHKVGFFGIMAFASVPNPLFDLAGITCGHFLVPFWSFFLPTLIGKAIIKMFLQTVVVIIAFNKSLMSAGMAFVTKVPLLGEILQRCVDTEKDRLRGSSTVDHHESVLSQICGYAVFSMVIYFLVTVVNAMAQNYHKRIYKQTQRAKNL